MTQSPTPLLPDHVLFLCTRNAVRSPMAAALGNRHCRQRISFESVGLEAGEPDPFAIAVMQELGIDITGHRPQSLADFPEDKLPALVVSLSPEAHHNALELTRDRVVTVEYWPMADPTLMEGSRTQILDAYRAVRDDLLARIMRRFPVQPAGHL